jgi:hypothetical protein
LCQYNRLVRALRRKQWLWEVIQCAAECADMFSVNDGAPETLWPARRHLVNEKSLLENAAVSSEDASKALTGLFLSVLVEAAAILWSCWVLGYVYDLEASDLLQVQAVFNILVRHNINCPLARLNTSI